MRLQQWALNKTYQAKLEGTGYKEQDWKKGLNAKVYLKPLFSCHIALKEIKVFTKYYRKIYYIWFYNAEIIPSSWIWVPLLSVFQFPVRMRFRKMQSPPFFKNYLKLWHTDQFSSLCDWGFQSVTLKKQTLVWARHIHKVFWKYSTSWMPPLCLNPTRKEPLSMS